MLIFVILGYVYLTLTLDLEKGHNLILSFDLKRVYAVAYIDEKMTKRSNLWLKVVFVKYEHLPFTLTLFTKRQTDKHTFRYCTC